MNYRANFQTKYITCSWSNSFRLLFHFGLSTYADLRALSHIIRTDNLYGTSVLLPGSNRREAKLRAMLILTKSNRTEGGSTGTEDESERKNTLTFRGSGTSRSSCIRIANLGMCRERVRGKIHNQIQCTSFFRYQQSKYTTFSVIA